MEINVNNALIHYEGTSGSFPFKCLTLHLWGLGVRRCFSAFLKIQVCQVWWLDTWDNPKMTGTAGEEHLLGSSLMQVLLWQSCRSSCVGLFLAASKNGQQTPAVDVPQVREGILIRRWRDFQNVFSGLRLFQSFKALFEGLPSPFITCLWRGSSPSFWAFLKTFVYLCTHAWNCSLVLDFQNSLQLPLLLQCCKGNTELNSKEWCNVWRELKTDVSGCLFLWLMPRRCSEDRGFGAAQPGLAVRFGTQRWFCKLKRSLPGCGALPAQAGWRWGANGEEEWSLWSPLLPCGPEVKLRLCCFTS